MASAKEHDTPTREVDVVDLADVPLDRETSPNLVDDLAQTMEAPIAPRVILLDAADLLVASAGFDRVTEQEVANAAGLGMDLYRSIFPERMDLLRGLHERFCSQTLRTVTEAVAMAIFEKLSAASCVERAMRVLGDAAFARAALLRAVLRSADPKLLEMERKLVKTASLRVSRALEAILERPRAEDVAFVLSLAMAVAHDAILTGTEANTDRLAQAAHAILAR